MRGWLKTALSLLIALTVGTTLALASGGAHAETKKLKVALLLEALTNDGSFNTFAYTALKKLADAGKVEFEVRENLADPAAAEPVIRLYASRGYDLILGHGIDLQAPILKVAKDFPNVHFSCSGGPDTATRLTDNVDGWTYDFGQQGYLAGYVVGKIDGISTVGIVGGPELAFIKAAHNGFKAGLAASNPKAKFIETYTGSFDDAQRALEATRSLASQGAQIVWTSGDGMANGVAAGAAAVGIRTLGVTGDAGGQRDKVNITSVMLNMTPIYDSYLDEIAKGTFGHHFVTADLTNEGLILTPVNKIGTGIPDNLEEDQAKIAADLRSGALKLPNFYPSN